jgi:serine/threonine protein kinase
LSLGKSIQIIETIASGGTAVLYKAVQTSLDRAVAVKKLHPHLTSDPNFTRRFILEAKAAASLDHENIVHVIDFGVEDESYQIVMEYVEGESLKQVMERWQPIPVDFALAVAHQVLLGLEHAHTKGIVHRDIKPGNILLTRYGKIKITDFGLAKLTQSQTQETAADSILGTPLYMSPEQAFGESVDCRSDLFSLGTMLYEMLTGKQPFADENYMGVIQNIINKSVPSPKRFKCDLPPSVESILSRALSKNRDARFQTATEFRLAIEEFLGAARLKELQEDLKSLLITNGATIALRTSSLTKSGTNRSSRKKIVAAGVFGAVAVAVSIALLIPGVRLKMQGWIGQSAAGRYAGGDAMKSTLTGAPYSDLSLPAGENPSPEATDPSSGMRDTTSTLASGAEGEVDSAQMENSARGPSNTGGDPAIPIPHENPTEQPVTGVSSPPDRAAADTQSLSPEETPANTAVGEEGAGGPAEKPQAKPIVKKGWLSVAASPSAEIHIDGRYVGDTPPTMSIELTSGYHKLECKNPLHVPYVEEIKIINGELSQRNITLKKLRGRISLAATEGAEFYVDGALVGVTPIMEPIMVDAGKHHLTLKRAGFHIWNSEVSIPANQVLPLKIVLSPKY